MNISRETNLIRFPQERRTAAVEDYRAEPAVILVLPVVRIERQRCVEAFDALNEAFRLLPLG